MYLFLSNSVPLLICHFASDALAIPSDVKRPTSRTKLNQVDLCVLNLLKSPTHQAKAKAKNSAQIILNLNI